MIVSLYIILIGTGIIIYKLAKESAGAKRALKNDHMNGHITKGTDLYIPNGPEKWELKKYMSSREGVEEADREVDIIFKSIPGLENVKLSGISKEARQYNRWFREVILCAKRGRIPDHQSPSGFSFSPIYQNDIVVHLTIEQEMQLMKWVQNTLRNNGSDVQFVYKDVGLYYPRYEIAPAYGDGWKYLD